MRKHSKNCQGTTYLHHSLVSILVVRVGLNFTRWGRPIFLLLSRRPRFLYRFFYPMFSVIQDLLPKLFHDRKVLFEPSAITFHIDDYKLFRFWPVKICVLILDEITLF